MCQDVQREVEGVRGCSGPSPSCSHPDQRLTALVPSQDSDIEETGHALRWSARHLSCLAQRPTRTWGSRKRYIPCKQKQCEETIQRGTGQEEQGEAQSQIGSDLLRPPPWPWRMAG